jgi:hypothetical protein
MENKSLKSNYLTVNKNYMRISYIYQGIPLLITKQTVPPLPPKLF